MKVPILYSILLLSLFYIYDMYIIQDISYAYHIFKINFFKYFWNILYEE